ncbi:hypothetical protein AGMMS49545_23420 [Betaproteobacteria bacterium]|nr:hypothetical protein AGMMS49545_23420 [Betaproteobacteria bacterium]GHU46478.1 hypothetical protein AGMMS50289_20010 [Betaproteobacteria bacterium]
MAINPTATAVVAQEQNRYAHSKTNKTNEETEAAKEVKRATNPIVANKHEANRQILEASARVSLSSGQESQALLFRSAIEHINSVLAPELGANAIQAAAANQDNSAEATANRILSLSTAFYDGYAKQHPGEDPEKLAKDFVAVIRGGFEKGYGEAKHILEGLKVFDGDVKSGVEKTFELVQQGYDKFLADKLAAINPQKNEKVDA